MISADFYTLRQSFKDGVITKLSTWCSYPMINLRKIG